MPKAAEEAATQVTQQNEAQTEDNDNVDRGNLQPEESIQWNKDKKESDEEEEPKVHEYAVREGPKTKEEQFHFDLIQGDMELCRKDTRPHSADLLAEVMGEDILEMDLDDGGSEDLECNWISQAI